MILGTIRFRDFEVPSRANFGGRQNLNTHRLGGGQRVVDVMGPESTNIMFSGVFSGPDATRRAQSVDLLRTLGKVVPLSWDRFYFDVIVGNFLAHYQNSIWIPFQVTCIVVGADASLRQALLAPSDGLASSMLATAAALLMTIPITSGYVLGLGLPDDGLANQTTAATNAGNLMSAQNGVAAGLVEAEGQFVQAASFQDMPPAAAVTALGVAEEASQSMSALVLARSYLSVAGVSSGIASYA